MKGNIFLTALIALATLTAAFGVDTATILTKLEPVLLAAAKNKEDVDPKGLEQVLEKVEKGYGKKMRATVAALLKKADGNGDGTLTKAEWLGFKKSAGGEETETNFRVMLPMKDGVHLATYVTLPDGPKPFPVILMRTPYRANFRPSGASRGYAVVVQDQRGRFASEGENAPFIGCGWEGHQDGAETAAWVKKQDWCNGKIATTGASAMGITQMFLAATGTPDIAAQYITVAAADLYSHAVYHGGALFKSQVDGWVLGNKYDPKSRDLYLAHPFYDDTWRAYDSIARAPLMNSPAVHEGGWFDTFSQGTLDGYLSRQTNGGPLARGKQRLIMGPWGHGNHHTNVCAEMTFPDGAFPKGFDDMSWFDFVVKGLSNGYGALPPVMYYVMGDISDPKAPGNIWRRTDRWPPKSQATPWYLTAKGELSTTPPHPGTRSLVCDPSNTCPTVGGRNLTLPKGPMDQRKIDGRPDVLIFDSQPLETAVEVTGRVSARVSLSTSARDTDVHLRLCDVYPDGRSMMMLDGMRRLSVREGREKPSPVEPGKTYRVEVDLWSTSVVFNKGHRIRLAVEASSYPRFDINPGTGRREGDRMSPTSTARQEGEIAVRQGDRVSPTSTSGHDAQSEVRHGDNILIQTNLFFMGGPEASHLELPVVGP